MAKSKIAKHHPTGSRNELDMMKLAYANNFPRRISSMCKLATVIKAIQRNLTKRQLQLFMKDIYGHFLKCRNFPFSCLILRNVLLKQVAHRECKEKDLLWFQIGEHLIHLSIGE